MSFGIINGLIKKIRATLNVYNIDTDEGCRWEVCLTTLDLRTDFTRLTMHRVSEM